MCMSRIRGLGFAFLARRGGTRRSWSRLIGPSFPLPKVNLVLSVGIVEMFRCRSLSVLICLFEVVTAREFNLGCFLRVISLERILVESVAPVKVSKLWWHVQCD